ncbi:DUF4352 domain-containing protein [Pediococcus pentosaceus]|uniref:DUF4352 domain-containing protein n=1 Tax=Pediococcus pentosaceus TaxID=1255 RepID=UPI00398220A4
MSRNVNGDKAPESKALGIIAIVFGALGLVLSWIPIVNNAAAIFAGIGIILGIIALLVNLHRSKLLAIIGTVLSVLAVGIVLATQNMYSNALDEATKSVNKSTSATSTSKTESKKKTSFAKNDTVDFDDVKFKVNSVNLNSGDDIMQPDQGKQFIYVNLTITNNSKENYDYNSFDFKLDDNGNQTSFDEITTDESVSQLNSGTLKPGASVTGTLVGQVSDPANAKLVYSGNILSNDENFSIKLQ